MPRALFFACSAPGRLLFHAWACVALSACPVDDALKTADTADTTDAGAQESSDEVQAGTEAMDFSGDAGPLGTDGSVEGTEQSSAGEDSDQGVTEVATPEGATPGGADGGVEGPDDATVEPSADFEIEGDPIEPTPTSLTGCDVRQVNLDDLLPAYSDDCESLGDDGPCLNTTGYFNETVFGDTDGDGVEEAWVWYTTETIDFTEMVPGSSLETAAVLVPAEDCTLLQYTLPSRSWSFAFTLVDGGADVEVDGGEDAEVDAYRWRDGALVLVNEAR